MPEQWKRFLENNIQDVRNAASKKYPVDKAQELDTTMTEFLLDLTPTNGTTGPPIIETPKALALQTRAALMTFVTALVRSL